MRFATSYFNPTLYRKNLARFWPLWAAWFILWLFIMPLNLFNQWNNYQLREQEGIYRFLRTCLNLNSDFAELSLFLGACYAVVVALAVFGYLFNHRSAATMHALPLRRENLFVTNYLSGLTFFLLPSVVVYGLSALVEFTTLPAELSALVLPTLWSGFWMRTAAELFFYSFAVFCAQFTGNAFALPAFYGILNVLVYAMYSLFMELGRNLFYGGWPFFGEPRFVELLTPFFGMYVASEWSRVGWSALWNSELNVPQLGELNLGFAYPATMAGYAVAGLVLTAAALLIYRRRHVETAGDVVSVKVVRPIFRVGVAVCVGLWGGTLTAAFFGHDRVELLLAVWVILWTVVGYFAAQMLLHKSFRVFKKSWKGCAVTAVVMAMSITACYLDVFGVETWVPDSNQVESVQVYINNTFPLDDAAYFNEDITAPAQVEKIVALHESIINDYKRYGDDDYGDHMMSVELVYLIDGMSYRKQYNWIRLKQDEINSPATTTWILDQFLNQPEVVEMAYGLDKARTGKVVCTGLENVVYASGRFDSVEKLEGAQEIWEAVQYDFAAGNLGVRYLFDDDVRYTQTYKTDLNLRFLIPKSQPEDEYLYYERTVVDKEYASSTVASDYHWNWSVTVTLTPKAERTLAALERYYDLGGAYDIALHDTEGYYQ